MRRYKFFFRTWPGRGFLALLAGAIVLVILLLERAHETILHGASEISPLTLAENFPRADGYDFDLPPVGSYQLPTLGRAPEGQVINHQATPHNLGQIFDGKISLVSFVYLMCADGEGCPLALDTLFEIYHSSHKVPALKKYLQLLTISFDPARDTPAALASFAYPVLSDPQADQKLDWHFLTTRSAEELQPLLAGFGQVVNRSGNSDVINHLLRLYLVDEQGRIRNIYGLGMIDPRLIIQDVALLLQEEQQQRGLGGGGKE